MRILLRLGLLLFSFGCAAPDVAPLPFYALPPSSNNNNNAPVWTCQNGYFRTRPSDPTLATCRPCTLRSCGPGTALVPCTPTDDATCASCEDTSQNRLVTYNAGCTHPICIDGTYNNSQTCVVCPQGAYCQGGVMQACGPNATTAGVGATTALLCIPLLGQQQQQQQGLATYFDFTLAFPTTYSDCSNMGQVVVLPWLQYGRLVDCTPPIYRDITLTAGYVVCLLLTTPAASTAGYAVWLQTTLAVQQTLIQTQLQACLSRPDLQLSAITSTALPLSAFNSLLLANSNQTATAVDVGIVYPGPIHPPDLVYPAQTWGQSPQDVMALLAALAILGTTLPIALCFLCAALWAQHRRRTTRAQLYHRLAPHWLNYYAR